MARFVAKRLLEAVLVLFVISLLVFAIFNVIPDSDPAQRMAGREATPTLIAAINEEWGFDEPLPVQYWTMMKLIFTGEVISYSTQLNVDEKIWENLPATLSLMVGAAVLWMFFGILFGYFSAIRAGRLADRLLTILAVAGISVPVFWLASIFLYYLTFKVELFPSGGYVPLSEDPLDWAYHLILPWTTLAILFVGLYSRVLRSSMLDSMNEDHVRTARAMGLSEHRVRTRHVLRNSLIPIVSMFGLDFGAMVGGGAILTEVVFGIEGVGLYAVESIGNFDLPPIMAVTLFGAFFIVLFNTLVDIAYARLDPKVRLGTSPR